MADAFVLPTHGEGWGRPVMEAMAMELPCIVTYWSGLTDLVDESTAILLKPTKMVPAYEDQVCMFGRFTTVDARCNASFCYFAARAA